MTGVVVTLVVYRSDPRVVVRALDALAASERAVTEVFLHVNADDGSWQAPASQGLRVEVSRSTENLGFAGAHNRLLALAFERGFELAIVHNPDVVLAPNAVGELLDASRTLSGLLGPLLERADGPAGRPTGLIDTEGITWTRDARHLDARHGLPMLPEPPQARRVDGISGACLAVPRVVYERILAAGGEFFDEDFIAYREDAELAIRAGVLGVESWLVPTARGLHVRTQRGTGRGRDPFVDMLGVRNRFLIAAKWGRRRPGSLPAALLRDAIVILAVFAVERSSLTGLWQALRLSPRMLEKRRRVLTWAREHPLAS